MGKIGYNEEYPGACNRALVFGYQKLVPGESADLIEDPPAIS